VDTLIDVPDELDAPGRRRAARTARILAAVRAIPEGFVRTYGDIDPGAPRLVGRVLAEYEGEAIPWHRVVRADGSVTQGRRQLERLRREGIPLRGERVDLARARLPRELGPTPLP
jgi:methylated-DNA-protein-cysteine methyltransferase-like protein